jgi:prepilin-type N-terminal cleavage/methylation domain-containing protein
VKSVVKTCSAFSLVELMIVVAILGILAAIVIPEFQDHSLKAKESAIKDNLRLLRQAIERYADRYGIAPGYLNNNPSETPSAIRFHVQVIQSGEYLSDMPENPFNGRINLFIVQSNEAFPPVGVSQTDYGWIYQPSTRKIIINKTGTDSEGVNYSDY